mmetsp:Transcript_734/g.1623  ORF Transcript_734/g.1623 Transcript_734/m.1623 type:complete len:272 (+) Transcript_734:58-873(+)
MCPTDTTVDRATLGLELAEHNVLAAQPMPPAYSGSVQSQWLQSQQRRQQQHDERAVVDAQRLLEHPQHLQQPHLQPQQLQLQQLQQQNQQQEQQHDQQPQQHEPILSAHLWNPEKDVHMNKCCMSEGDEPRDIGSQEVSDHPARTGETPEAWRRFNERRQRKLQSGRKQKHIRSVTKFFTAPSASGSGIGSNCSSGITPEGRYGRTWTQDRLPPLDLNSLPPSPVAGFDVAHRFSHRSSSASHDEGNSWLSPAHSEPTSFRLWCASDERTL